MDFYDNHNEMPSYPSDQGDGKAPRSTYWLPDDGSTMFPPEEKQETPCNALFAPESDDQERALDGSAVSEIWSSNPSNLFASPSPDARPSIDSTPLHTNTDTCDTPSRDRNSSPSPSNFSPSPSPDAKASGDSPPQRPKATTMAPVLPNAMSQPVRPGDQTAQPDPYVTSTFPPGQHRVGFVPFADARQASIQQGNYWPINSVLRDQILVAEVDKRDLRGSRLEYDQVLDKYPAWKAGPTASTLRGRARNAVLAAHLRPRKPTFDAADVRALQRAVPLHKKAGGDISWDRVKAAVTADTKKVFGTATLKRKWEAIS